MYENNPLQGSLFERALRGTFNLEREELQVTATPYFFSTNTRDSNQLSYQWGENGKKIGSPLVSSNLIFRNPGLQASGISNISVSTEHVDNILQDATMGFSLNVIGSNQINLENDDEVTVF
jgi:hypothetical protein